MRRRYKLTGGVFSRKPAHLEAARREFRVGNLYLNRGITGALVGRQPFGGFGLSGVGTKAGGADYLLHFVEPRCSRRKHHAPRLRPGIGLEFCNCRRRLLSPIALEPNLHRRLESPPTIREPQALDCEAANSLAVFAESSPSDPAASQMA